MDESSAFQAQSSREAFRIEARAKVNLYLQVGGLRPDGYHDIRTVFHSIGLSDLLTFETANDLEVTCSDPDLPSGPGNLVHRAAVLLSQVAGVSAGARIQVEKRIPSQAGLGGGSADAAAALLGLRHLWRLSFPDEALRQIGAQLGADVPFCIRGGAAYAEGIGEALTPLAPMADAPVVVIKPRTAISTREAYQALDAAPDRQAPDPETTLRALRDRRMEALRGALFNDFQAVALSSYPEVHHAYEALKAVAGVALLSGSGSALFALVDTIEHATYCVQSLREAGWLCWATRLADRSVQFIDEDR